MLLTCQLFNTSRHKQSNYLNQERQKCVTPPANSEILVWWTEDPHFLVFTPLCNPLPLRVGRPLASNQLICILANTVSSTARRESTIAAQLWGWMTQRRNTSTLLSQTCPFGPVSSWHWEFPLGTFNSRGSAARPAPHFLLPAFALEHQIT